ncbi:MAG TPA: hypothetical protein VJT31_26510 [Rugosimonospora sp.]|nr:hypothetical protein [Rugosimonospora sp.]
MIGALLAVLGAAQAVLFGVPRTGPPVVEAHVDSLAATVVTAGWVQMDPDTMGDPHGYQMPLSMMPGMPGPGQARLEVSLSVVNQSRSSTAVDPAAEFVLRSRDRGRWPPVGDTFAGLSRLPAGSAVDGVLFFDVPAQRIGSAGFYVDWKHGGRNAELILRIGGSAAPHVHGG